jgi:hypothetical protein
MNNNPITDPKTGGYIATIIGTLFIISVMCADQYPKMKNGFESLTNTFKPPQNLIQAIPAVRVEAFGNDSSGTNATPNHQNSKVTENFYDNNSKANGVRSNAKYAVPNGQLPGRQQTVNLNSSGDQLLTYQIYQQAVNAATPTIEQLDSISGQSQQQTGPGAIAMGGGLSADTAPYDILNGNLYDSEFQAVNFANERAQSISACAQNAPTFVATSLLPKPSIPGQQSWDINAPSNILANQNFLAATQQVGIDTVLGSSRNTSYDIRNTIPNPINVVSPWMNTSITPDLERRPLDTFIPADGIYGAGTSGGCNMNATFVGK